MTKSAALEASLIRPCELLPSPGPIETGMLSPSRELRKAGAREDRASRSPRPARGDRFAAVVLASDTALSVTGQILTIDGGKTAA
jgi:NAD(P)-dependent dehydrogenase (short-subunit alcohol dehydrogenase family)